MIVTDTTLHWETAQKIAMAACKYASDKNLRICAWVLDKHGNPLSMQRINNAPMPSTKIAQGKAHTAVSFGFGTHLWQEKLAEKQYLLDGLNAQDDVVMFGGGLPIKHKDEIIGAIGISGASEAQDQQCAEAGIAAFIALNSSIAN
ncbi:MULTISPECIES: heme-binding protein [unclassified Neptuniibacter]|uniref:GlcG/HbpS family heme-binding protein n=1 Tax=unclassified Neptuniibacter TaxID=2630693 RepID=UPI000C43637E|nr:MULTISPECIES: heme-binding protein [unclassified Neptuniibacter]MAY41656.1 cobalamin adenosyltransferase [Oceanospirillaceae bacterium]|tara:strand:- start:10822 stop:11259 length:438 start_codon:yes stop_codon:yes gene_type:complete